MAGHVHAENMIDYGHDAKETDEPWLRWQFKEKGSNEWIQLNGNPCWNECAIYRRKPKTISINGFDVPMAEIDAPQKNSEYFTVSIVAEELFNRHIWCNDLYDKHWLKCGLVHLTKEAAIQHAKALLSFTERKE